MKSITLSLIFLLLSCLGFSQPDSIYYYNNGAPFYLTYQPDVLSFKLNDHSKYEGTFDPAIVDHVEYYGHNDGIHNVYFNAAATELDKETVGFTIQGHPNFQKFFAVVTKTSNIDAPYSQHKWMATDMQMTIVFKDEQIALEDVEAFAAEYHTRVVFAPEIAGGVYVLEVAPNHQIFDISSPTLTIEIVRQMWLDHAAIIDKIAPSVRIFETHSEDPLYLYQWWMDDALTASCNAGHAAAGTGIDLPCAWNYDHEYSDGPMYSGQDVVVGVIDFHGVQWDHPDLNGSFDDGYVAFGLEEGETTVISINAEGSNVFHMAWNEAHLQNVSGVISADIDNDQGSAGVAHNSTIIPCLMQGTTAQFDALLMELLAEGGDRQVDIINMSFGFTGMTVAEAEGFPFSIALEMCKEDGRDGKGIVMVSSAGNENGEVINVPAAMPMVLSVAATNPNDQLKTAGDGYDPFDYSWGSSYFNYLDVAAPGLCISSTDFSDEGTGFPEVEGKGYAIGDYHSFDGTSASAPIVSGIAALILEKDPSLSYEQVYDAIRYSAEKVGGYDYSTFAPNGRCLELGYGRVNACAALNILDQLDIEENINNLRINYVNPVVDFLQVTLEDYTAFSVELMSLTGQVIYQNKYVNTSTFEIDMTAFASGIYYLNVTDNDEQKSTTVKIIKQ